MYRFNARFPVLSIVATVLLVVGALGLVGSVILFLLLATDGDRPWAALLGIPPGLLVIAVGESIYVLFAIEANTRAMAEWTRTAARPEKEP